MLSGKNKESLVEKMQALVLLPPANFHSMLSHFAQKKKTMLLLTALLVQIFGEGVDILAMMR